jgi:hypothetical protein
MPLPQPTYLDYRDESIASVSPRASAHPMTDAAYGYAISIRIPRQARLLLLIAVTLLPETVQKIILGAPTTDSKCSTRSILLFDLRADGQPAS